MLGGVGVSGIVVGLEYYEDCEWNLVVVGKCEYVSESGCEDGQENQVGGEMEEDGIDMMVDVECGVEGVEILSIGVGEFQ